MAGLAPMTYSLPGASPPMSLSRSGQGVGSVAVGSGRDESAAHGQALDDAPVPVGVGGCGDRGDQGVQVGGAAGAWEFAAQPQGGGDGDGVDGFAAPVHGRDGLVDEFVLGPVEVGAREVVDFFDSPAGQQHAAQDGLFGRLVLWWCPVEGLGVGHWGSPPTTWDHTPAPGRGRSVGLRPVLPPSASRRIQFRHVAGQSSLTLLEPATPRQ